MGNKCVEGVKAVRFTKERVGEKKERHTWLHPPPPCAFNHNLEKDP